MAAASRVPPRSYLCTEQCGKKSAETACGWYSRAPRWSGQKIMVSNRFHNKIRSQQVFDLLGRAL